MRYLSLSIPGTDGESIQIDSDLPTGVPTGGLDTTGANAIGVFLIVIIISAILFALWSIVKGGLDMIQSGGVKEKVQRARERILYASLGLALIFLSFTFVRIISDFFGVNLLPFLKFQ